MDQREWAERFPNLEAEVRELKGRLETLQRTLERLIVAVGGEDLGQVLESDGSFAALTEGRAAGWPPPLNQQEVVAALRNLDTTLSMKLEAIRYLEPVRIATSMQPAVAVALNDLYSALSAPDWENPLHTPGAQPATQPGQPAA